MARLALFPPDAELLECTGDLVIPPATLTAHLTLLSSHEKLLERTGDLIVPPSAQRAPDSSHVEVERLPQVGAGPQQCAAHRHDVVHVKLQGG